MDADTSLADRLVRIEARLAIEELAHRYCLAMDEQDPELLRALFTRDSEVTADNGWMQGAGAGLEGVLAMYRAFWSTLGATYHWMHGQVVTFDPADADAASGIVMGHAETWRIPKAASYLIAMRYHDRYRREDGTWRFAARRVSFLYFCKAEEYPGILGTALRMTVRGAGEKADWPARPLTP